MPSTAMPQRRIVWIDQAKGFLICLVLLGHSLEIVGFDSLPGSAAVWYGIYSFHMMAFFSVSGLLFFYQWRQRGLLDWKRIFRREMSLSVPTALFSVIHIGIRFGCGLDPSIIASILQTVSRFWFVFVLILIEFLVPVLALPSAGIFVWKTFLARRTRCCQFLFCFGWPAVFGTMKSGNCWDTFWDSCCP